MKIIVKIIEFPECLDEYQRVTSYIDEGKYKMVITGKSIPECFEQIAISMYCIDFIPIKIITNGK